MENTLVVLTAYKTIQKKIEHEDRAIKNTQNEAQRGEKKD